MISVRKPTLHAGLIVASAVGMGLVTGCTSPEPISDRPPNIVVVVFDDLGFEGFGTCDNDLDGWTSQILSPRLDTLARTGMRFTSFSTVSPVCSPTRVSLLTGTYPQQLNIRKQLPFPSRRGIPAAVTTLPEMLRMRGYRTAHFGKWHVGRRREEFRPAEVGFDEAVTLRAMRYTDPKLVFSNGEVRKVRGHSTAILTGLARDFIRRNQDRPFFVNLWLWAPHTPFQAPPGGWHSLSSFDHYRGLGLGRTRSQFAALISNADDKVGELLDEITDLGLQGDTIVVVTADNGGMILDNGPLRGRKGQPFEGGTRVPLVVQWPGRVVPGTVSDAPLMSFDMVPTLAEAAGIDPGRQHLDGVSFLDLLLGEGEPPSRDVAVWETTPCRGVTEEYLAAHPEGRWHDFAVRRGPWKLVHEAVPDNRATHGISRCKEVPLQDPAWHLFNIDEDPTETSDRKDSRADQVNALYADYLDWRASVARIPIEVAEVVDAARVKGHDIVLAGGYLRLRDNTLYDFHDGNFSLTALVNPATHGPGQRIIAGKRGSWRLSLEADGRVNLMVVDHRSGERAELSSPQPLPIGRPTRVGFSVFNWTTSPAVVRLFVGDDLVDQDAHTIKEVRCSTATVTVGGIPGPPSLRFRGRLGDLELRVASLMFDDVIRLEGGTVASIR